MSEIEELRQSWRTLYAQTLPSLARSKDPAQKKWPVTLDHCFARIILDNTVGAENGSNEMVQWDKVLQRPAVKHMTEGQLKQAISLGNKIRSGEEDLVELDRKSLVARGKEEGKYGGKKRKRDDDDSKTSADVGEDNKKQEKAGAKSKKQSTLGFAAKQEEKQEQSHSPTTFESEPSGTVGEPQSQMRTKSEKELDTTSQLSSSQMQHTLKRIQTHPGLTPYRQRLYTCLLSVPRGQFTTYQAMAEHLGSVARAVGNGMMNNPFAPDVPCHRVLASDRSIGGFGGDWSRNGKNTEKQNLKVRLLKEEGVKFDSTGKVKGPVWRAFWDLEDFEKEYGKVP